MENNYKVYFVYELFFFLDFFLLFLLLLKQISVFTNSDITIATCITFLWGVKIPVS